MWSADLVRLADDLQRIAPHADILHIDVADGHFAPALLFFPDAVAAIKKMVKTPIHIHLMVADTILLTQIEQFCAAGADLISFHVENESIATAALDLLEKHGVAAGLVLRVETPVAKAKPFLAHVRFLTLLGTAIGVKGQGLNNRATQRLEAAKKLIVSNKPLQRIVLAADGAIRDTTVPLLRKAGAETVVLGSLAFAAPDLGERMAWLKTL